MRKSTKPAVIDGAPIGGQGQVGIPVDTDPDALLEKLHASFDKVGPSHFDGAEGMAVPACDLLNDRVLSFAGTPGAKARLADACVAALKAGNADAFEAIARGLRKYQKDNQVAHACIEAVEQLERVPSFAEIHRVLPWLTKKTLQRRLREIGVRLPQAGRSGSEPRRRS